MNDVEPILNRLADALAAVVAEVTPAWFVIQLVLLLLAAAAAAAIAAWLRRRTDVMALTAGWPWLARLFAQAIAANLGAIVFLAIVAFMQIALLEITLPARSYLLGVADKLVTAWVVINLAAGFIRNRLVFRLIAVF